jgi:hypothetical protein
MDAVWTPKWISLRSTVYLKTMYTFPGKERPTGVKPLLQTAVPKVFDL